MRVGVLALQGDHAAHAAALARAAPEGARLDVRLVRRVDQLEGLRGLVLPGGESTTLLKLLALDGLDAAIRRFAAAGGALFGTCAGAILLARVVRNPAQPSLGLLDAVAERNSYGRQVDSFTAELQVARRAGWAGGPLTGVFIRAPRLVGLGTGVEVMARHGQDPVLVREDRHLAATFHPELTSDVRVHALFLALAMAPSPTA